MSRNAGASVAGAFLTIECLWNWLLEVIHMSKALRDELDEYSQQIHQAFASKIHHRIAPWHILSCIPLILTRSSKNLVPSLLEL